ncbi:helix-turn-helix transcriptional regulator [Superficieibacter electus]|uniref:Helix-turn-helix transcriptional regulator n=1 Tax=Superficieibacter electus TaxID=2022662 RepID=A0A2P5GJQ9_9ENTR|nr:helix-turn-helix transcriptional regulator [Superficieibacter electus]POP41895.1 helix-turn-helix transcriptional regulator [Superficieibacter electus]POP44202.1 helix-turn-helix transcriptional regulator [Superficieibacter electus]
MGYQGADQMRFFSEMSERQISAREFFSSVLIDAIERNFGFKKILISYFDTQGKFLSWVNWNGVMPDSVDHPYRKFVANDIVRHVIHQEAVVDQLTYFNVIPRLYKSTDVIGAIDYEHSGYVRFLEENFQQHYSVTMAFGINAYIQVAFFKTLDAGDFSNEEIELLNRIYVYVANSYKNFKKHEQIRIVSNIQNEIISSGERAYLVTDDFMHIMSSNDLAQEYLKDILGTTIAEQISSSKPCNWLPFLLGSENDSSAANRVQTRIIKNYIFKIYTYDQSYSNGIVDTYHWITISQKGDDKAVDYSGVKLPLTQAEQKVATLMYNGLTYQAIADELVISYHTVKKHIQNIYIKCGVNSRFQLYKWFEDKEREGAKK